MKYKEFFKPTILKIIIFIILMWITSKFLYNNTCNCMIEAWMCGSPIYCKTPIILVGLLIIPLYLFSCLIIFIINKSKNK